MLYLVLSEVNDLKKRPSDVIIRVRIETFAGIGFNSLLLQEAISQFARFLFCPGIQICESGSFWIRIGAAGLIVGLRVGYAGHALTSIHHHLLKIGAPAHGIPDTKHKPRLTARITTVQAGPRSRRDSNPAEL